MVRDRKKQTKVAIMLGGFGLFLIVLFLWAFNYEQGYKTYTNEAAGFSVKYPNLWHMRDNIEGAVVGFFTGKQNELDSFSENVNIVVTDISDQNITSINEYSEVAILQIRAVFKEEQEVLNARAINLSGNRGHMLDLLLLNKKGTNIRIYMAWTIRNKMAYQFTYTAEEPEFDKFFNRVEKMRDSFRLL